MTRGRYDLTNDEQFAQLPKELDEARKLCTELLKQVMHAGPGIIEAKDWAKYNTAIVKYLDGIITDRKNAKKNYDAAFSALISMRFLVEQCSQTQDSVMGLFMEIWDPSIYEHVNKAKIQLKALEDAVVKIEQIRKQIEEIRKQIEDKINREQEARNRSKSENINKDSHKTKTKTTTPPINNGARLQNVFKDLVKFLKEILQYMLDGKTATLNHARVYKNKVAAGLESVRSKAHKVTTPLYRRKSQPERREHSVHGRGKIHPSSHRT